PGVETPGSTYEVRFADYDRRRTWQGEARAQSPKGTLYVEPGVLTRAGARRSEGTRNRRSVAGVNGQRRDLGPWFARGRLGRRGGGGARRRRSGLGRLVRGGDRGRGGGAGIRGHHRRGGRRLDLERWLWRGRRRGGHGARGGRRRV